MRDKCLIAVCDILGFSYLVEKNPLDSVVDNALGWFRQALNHSVHKGEFPSTFPPTRDLDSHQHVGVSWFSDTILFYTKDDTDEAVRQLLLTVGWLLFETMLEGTTRVRAGIAYGEAHIDKENSLYVGLPIIEAYNLEKQQQWAGAALTKSACARIPEYARTGKFADWWIVPYDVPLKGGEVLTTLAVNWNWGIHAPDWRLLWSKSSELPTEEAWANDASVCEKFLNTKRFHELHCHDCKRRVTN